MAMLYAFITSDDRTAHRDQNILICSGYRQIGYMLAGARGGTLLCTLLGTRLGTLLGTILQKCT